jgi:hypothetical protein
LPSAYGYEELLFHVLIDVLKPTAKTKIKQKKRKIMGGWASSVSVKSIGVCLCYFRRRGVFRFSSCLGLRGK